MKIEPKLEQEAKLMQLYQGSIRKFADRWVAGLYDRLERENPGLMRQIDVARSNLDDVWIAVRQGKAEIIEFKMTLQQWDILHLKAINTV